MDDAIYFPVLPAKLGEIEAIGRLSPFAEVRVRPTLDVPLPRPEVSLDQHLAGIADSVAKSWGTRLPLYFDFSRFEPEIQIAGQPLVEYFFRILRQHQILAMPVSGPLSIRGPGTAYVDAVSSIVRQDKRGVALRIPFDDIHDPSEFSRVVDEAVTAINVNESDVELFLDASALEVLPDEVRTEESLFTAYNEILRLLSSHAFRSIIVCASSIPKTVPRSTDGNPQVVSRVEYAVWLKLLEKRAGQLIRFGVSAP